jgi:hypothetical protein
MLVAQGLSRSEIDPRFPEFNWLCCGLPRSRGTGCAIGLTSFAISLLSRPIVSDSSLLLVRRGNSPLTQECSSDPSNRGFVSEQKQAASGMIFVMLLTHHHLAKYRLGEAAELD